MMIMMMMTIDLSTAGRPGLHDLRMACLNTLYNMKAISFHYNITDQWIVPQFLNLRPKMAKSIVYVITLITNRNHAFHCLN